MSTCNPSNRDGNPYPAGFTSCWEWVASLPSESLQPGLIADSSSTTNEPSERLHTLPHTNPLKLNLFFLLFLVLAGSVILSRKRGIQGLSNGSKSNAGDIYQLALATRKARERHSVVALSDCG